MRFLCLILFFLIIPFSSIQAAEFFLKSDNHEFALGQEKEVFIFFNSENDLVNALEGIVNYPDDLLELKEVRSGNSFVNLWVEGPRIKSSGNLIFSGITPSGYNGSRGFVFSLVFEAKASGVGKIYFKNLKALKNDGLGTGAVVKQLSFNFNIDKSNALKKIDFNDVISPDGFMPIVASSSYVFNGQNILVFVAQDKNSGMDHFKIKEVKQMILWPFYGWKVGQSPYLLQDQQLQSYIYVKAVDKLGNEKIAKLKPNNQLGTYQKFHYWLVALLTLFIIFGIINMKYLRNKNK